MSDPSTSDIINQYKTISSKLKKRFLRKPNVQEASEQYGSLAKHCESQGLPQYAGLLWQAVARCENDLNHTSGEVAALVRGGRQFLKAEQDAAAIGCPSAGGENLEAAEVCFTQAGSRAEQQNMLGMPTAAGLYLELGNLLRDQLRSSGSIGLEAAQGQFSKAAGLLNSNPLAHLHSLGLVASCMMEQADYDGALNVLNEMVSTCEKGPQPSIGVYRDIARTCEVTRVLLLLLLQPTPHRLSPSLAHLLEKYTWGEYSSSTGDVVDEELFLLLQSLVMATQSQDMRALCALESDLWQYLSSEQRCLLRTLVSSVGRSSCHS